jgi:5-methylcytosine-specific restriction endonuclease McrA
VTPPGKRYCEKCQKEKWQQNAQTRTDDGPAFYKSAAWVRTRKIVIARDKWCVICREQGRYKLSTVADHIKPRADYPELALDLNNLRGICGTCHGIHGSRAKRKK